MGCVLLSICCILCMCYTFGLLPVVVLALLQPIPALTQRYMQWLLGHLRHPFSQPLEHVIRVIYISSYLKLTFFLLASAALCCLLLIPALCLHLGSCLHPRLLHLQQQHPSSGDYNSLPLPVIATYLFFFPCSCVALAAL